MANDKRLVWDLPLRLFHWLLALSILSSYLTAKTADFYWMQIHMRLGYWTFGLILFRVIWGFVGPRHARFANFLPSPTKLFWYLKGFFGGKTIHSIGHNPMGSLMVVLMLALVAFQVFTGLFTSDGIFTDGPYVGAVDGDTAMRLRLLHGFNFNLILAAISVHILAIILYRVVKKERLVGPMITGKKPAEHVPEAEAIHSSQLPKAVLVALISALVVYLVIHFAPAAPIPEY